VDWRGCISGSGGVKNEMGICERKMFASAGERARL